jgi:hypothetical protein
LSRVVSAVLANVLFLACYMPSDSEGAESFRCTAADGSVTYAATECPAENSCSRWDGRRWSPEACRPTSTSAGTRATSATLKNHTAPTQRIARDHAFGCQSRETFERIINLNAQGDHDAAGTAIALGMAGGECAALERGSEIYVEDTAILAGLVKVRPRGKLVAYWTVRPNIE